MYNLPARLRKRNKTKINNIWNKRSCIFRDAVVIKTIREYIVSNFMPIN